MLVGGLLYALSKKRKSNYEHGQQQPNENEHDVLEEQRAEIESKQKALTAQKEQNTKIVTKIKTFLEN